MIKKFFLEEVVDYTFRKYDDIRNLKIIFPNRRAGLYFQKALSKKINKAMWSPKVLTMEEFVQGYVDIKISDEVSDNILLKALEFSLAFFICDGIALERSLYLSSSDLVSSLSKNSPINFLQPPFTSAI